MIYKLILQDCEQYRTVSSKQKDNWMFYKCTVQIQMKYADFISVKFSDMNVRGWLIASLYDMYLKMIYYLLCCEHILFCLFRNKRVQDARIKAALHSVIFLLHSSSRTFLFYKCICFPLLLMFNH